VEAAAQAVLDARAQYPTSTLADLYDPLAMPALLCFASGAPQFDTLAPLAARKKSLAMSGGKRHKSFWFSSKRDFTTTRATANGCIPE